MEAKLKTSGLKISAIDAMNIARYLRGKELEKSKRLLQEILAHKKALPHIKSQGSSAHKPGKVMAGSYPEKAAKMVLGLLESVESNAKEKGMVSPFIINFIKADKGALQWHYGRHRRQRVKNTHMEIKLVEKTERSEDVGSKTKHEAGVPAEKTPSAKEKKEEPKAKPVTEKKTQTKEVKTEAPKAEKKESSINDKPKEVKKVNKEVAKNPS